MKKCDLCGKKHESNIIRKGLVICDSCFVKFYKNKYQNKIMEPTKKAIGECKKYGIDLK